MTWNSPGLLAGVAEEDVLDEGEDLVVVAAGQRALDVVAGVERQAQARHGLAERGGLAEGSEVRVFESVIRARTSPSRIACRAGRLRAA